MFNARVFGVLCVVSTGRSKPVVSSIATVFGFVIGVFADHRASACVTEFVAIFVEVLGLICNGLLGMRTGNFVPVVLSVIGPILRVRMFAELLRTNRTESVAFFIGVSFLALRLYVVSAGNCVPVVEKINSILFSIGVLVVVVPLASVTDTVIVFVSVSCLAGNFNGVRAGYVMPVIVLIVRPAFSVGVFVVVVPLASITDTVVVFVSVSCLESNVDGVSTCNFLPVIVLIVRPILSVFVFVTVVPFTNVTETVVVFVSVSFNVFNFSGVRTNSCVPVVNFIVSPAFGEIVLAVLIFTNRAVSVVFYVSMCSEIFTDNGVSASRSVEMSF